MKYYCNHRHLRFVSFTLIVGALSFYQRNTDAVDGPPQDEFVQFVDISDSPSIFQTDKLPSRNEDFLERYMATIGNGHIATTIYTDTVFMNGVYNGFKGESHRAKIPSRNNIRVQPVCFQCEDSDRSFSLDVSKGYNQIYFTSLVTYSPRHKHETHKSAYTTEILILPYLAEGFDYVLFYCK